MSIFVMRVLLHISLPLLLLLSACGKDSDAPQPRLDQDLLEAEIRHLGSDDFAGRFPGSEGGLRTEAYLEKRFRELGLEPVPGPTGEASYRQRVPLVSITSESSMLQIGSREWQPEEDFVGFTLRTTKRTKLVDSPLVFVGYGINAPEENWNDYAGLDVRGKTVVMLINDPGFATKDPELFRGYAMTYYGRWTYKFAEAARQGATGAIIIHDDAPASYPWATVRNSWTGEQLHIQPENGNADRCEIEIWAQKSLGEWIFQQSGRDLAEEMRKASQRGFQGFELDLTASVRLQNKLRNFTSDNILGQIPGKSRPDEVVLITSHWDHLGHRPEMEGDNIFNGALDNATGTSGLLVLAKAIMEAGPLPRTLIFAAVTAEEQGLLGSEWLGLNPPVPTRNLVAAVNMDGLNIYGPTKDIEVVGYGFSELDDYLAKAAKKWGRSLKPYANPERGSYFRSDHFSLAKVGVPGLYTSNGIEHIEMGAEWMKKMEDAYIATNYHRPGDEVQDWWRFDGASADLELLLDVILQLGETSDFPAWAEKSEFRPIREKDGR